MVINMKICYHRNYGETAIGEDLATPTLREDLKRTRIALEIAYAGFDNAVDEDMIDCYIYEINALQKRYRHLSQLLTLETERVPAKSYPDSPIRSLVSHVFS
ncbi:MAG: YaaL family protein [Clostridium sp.]|jgi:hypothetical protein|nr:YaaL family protein [Clostridium sp.]